MKKERTWLVKMTSRLESRLALGFKYIEKETMKKQYVVHVFESTSSDSFQMRIVRMSDKRIVCFTIPHFVEVPDKYEKLMDKLFQIEDSHYENESITIKKIDLTNKVIEVEAGK